MVNSFWGYEKPVLLPPNVQLIGPLTKSNSPWMEMLKEKDEALFNWLEDAKAKGEDVVYITLGSIVKLQPWSINAIYQGLKNVGCRVVWSLKDEALSMIEDNP